MVVALIHSGAQLGYCCGDGDEERRQ